LAVASVVASQELTPMIPRKNGFHVRCDQTLTPTALDGIAPVPT
jgi:hypothetical protein